MAVVVNLSGDHSEAAAGPCGLSIRAVWTSTSAWREATVESQMGTGSSGGASSLVLHGNDADLN